MQPGEAVATRPMDERPGWTHTAPGADPSVDDSGDADLVRRVLAGDRTAFDALYARYVSRVYGVCLRMVADVRCAERLTQDTFVLAWRQLGSFRGTSAFPSWLHRIAVNVVLQDARTTRRREARIEPMPEPGRLDMPVTPAEPELRIELERAVATLPPRARTVLVLHDIEGYTHAEIAALTGTAIGTTKAQLHRARRLLRERLGR